MIALVAGPSTSTCVPSMRGTALSSCRCAMCVIRGVHPLAMPTSDMDMDTETRSGQFSSNPQGRDGIAAEIERKGR
eukprot:1764379-Prymnesium_polylepis.4